MEKPKNGCGVHKPAAARCEQNQCGACCGGGCVAPPETLSAGERRLLERFGELAFLPLVREKGSGLVTLLEADVSESMGRTLLSLLQRRGLVRVDADEPLINYDYSAWGENYERGSAALTARGQDELDDYG